MSVNRRRAYNSPLRADQANATRRQIVDTAAALFAERGYAAVTMAEVARQAAVSVATVYLYFPGKAAIVAAMADALTAEPELSVEQVERATNPREQMRIGARILRTLNERAWPVIEILRGAHGTDPRLAEIWEAWRQRHLDAIRRAVAAVDAVGGLRDGLAPEEAVDVLFALGGTDVYRALVRERGWSPERYEQWLLRIGCAELLGIDPDAP